jgi:Right handed beta helix region
VTITKSLTIDGGGITGSILAALVNGIIVNLPNATDKVTLRNLSINGAGNGLNGIRFIQNGRLHVENCTIHGFGGSTGRGIDFAPTALNTVLTVKNTSIRENFGAGIALGPTATGSVNATIDNVEVENNQNGIIANDKSKVMITNTRAANNVSNGFVAVGSANGNPEMFISNSTTAHNGSNGIRTQGTGTPKIRIANMNITNNATGISIGVGEVRSFGNNQNDGNGAGPANNGTPTAGNILLQ